MFELLAVHLEEDVVSDLGPPRAVDPPSAAGAASGAGVGHHGIRPAGWQPVWMHSRALAGGNSRFGPGVKRTLNGMEVRLIGYPVWRGTSAFAVCPHHLTVEVL